MTGLLVMLALCGGATVGFVTGVAVVKWNARRRDATGGVESLGDDWYAVPVDGKIERWHVEAAALKTERPYVYATRDDGEYVAVWTDTKAHRHLEPLRVAHCRAVRLRSLQPPPSEADRALREAADLVNKLNNGSKT